jgi:hypothetical protein
MEITLLFLVYFNNPQAERERRNVSSHTGATRDKQTTAEVTAVVAWRFRRAGINSGKLFLASSCLRVTPCVTAYTRAAPIGRISVKF